MPISLVSAEFTSSKIQPLLVDLKRLYERMDQEYLNIASGYGFICRGCTDNCCRTRFHHHTVIEFCYLLKGFDLLGKEERNAAIERADWVAGMPEKVDEPQPRQMCPLNLEGRCIVYDYRPMICRLHGIPHELQRPGCKPVLSPGCGDFDRQSRHKSYIRFDRTPLYLQLAGLEKQCREMLAFSGKIKLTVAEMIIRS